MKPTKKKQILLFTLLVICTIGNVSASSAASSSTSSIADSCIADSSIPEFEVLRRCTLGIDQALWGNDEGLSASFTAEEGTPGERAFNVYMKVAMNIAGASSRHLSSVMSDQTCYGRSFIGKDRYIIEAFKEDINRQGVYFGKQTTVVDIGAGHGFATLNVASAFINEPVDIISVEINPRLVQHLTNLSELHANRGSFSTITALEGNITKGIRVENTVHGLLALNVLHFVDPNKWGTFFVNCAQLINSGVKLFLTVSAPSSIQEFQTKSMYDYQKDKLKKEWPGHMVRFDYIHAGGRGVAYTPYLTYGLDQALGTTIKKEGYSKLPDQLKTFEITSIAIPCLVFSLEELTEKLRRYAPQFNIKQVVGLTATGGPTSVETDHASIGAILEKK